MTLVQTSADEELRSCSEVLAEYTLFPYVREEKYEKN